MSNADFLFQNSAPAAWTTPSYSSTTSPEWWQAASQGLITRASQIAGQAYQPYSGPRIAGQDALQEKATADATAYQPGVNSAFDQAKDLTGQAGQLFNQDDFSKFQSPYTEGVVNRIAQLGQRNLSENLLPSVNDTFIKAGQFGGSRNQDFTLRALRDTNESILGQQATALENSQKDAMSNYQTAQQRQGQAGAQYGQIAGQMGTEARNEIGAENQIGIQNQAQQQKNLDLATSDFQNQVNYPLQQLQMLSGIIHGYAPQSGIGTETKYTSTPTYGSTSPLTNAANVAQSWYGGSAQQ